jgi:CDP-diacylglycerol--serine O-phosphatidyltransferase
VTLPKPMMGAIRFIPTAITLAALVSGLLSIYASFQSLEFGANASGLHLRASLLIMLAMILDGLDGNVARLLNATSALGGELDTFVDLTAFGIAPALLIYTSASGFPPLVRIVLGCALVASGAYRLSRFKVIDPHRGHHGFTGLPITICAAMVATVHILALQAPDSWGVLKFDLSQGPAAVGVLVLVVLLALLQVSRIHYPKPTTNLFFFAGSIVLVILLFSGLPVLAAGSALAMVAFGIYYITVTPFLKQKG